MLWYSGPNLPCQPGGSPSREPRKGGGVWERGSNDPPPYAQANFPLPQVLIKQ